MARPLIASSALAANCQTVVGRPGAVYERDATVSAAAVGYDDDDGGVGQKLRRKKRDNKVVVTGKYSLPLARRLADFYRRQLMHRD